MVGKRDRAGALEGGEGEGEAIASHIRRAKALQRLTVSRSHPPPRNDIQGAQQAHDVSRQSADAVETGASAISGSIRSASAGAGVASSRTERGHADWRAGDCSHGRARDAARWLAELAPAQLPPGIELGVDNEHSKWYRVRLAALPLRVTLEIEIWLGELWAHLAITGRTSPPSGGEVGYCRDLFLGDRKAIQVLPRKLERSEAGSRTIHLYAPLESDSLPAFSRAYHDATRSGGW